MQELLSTFHVDGRLIIAQLVNFAIVLVMINYVIVRPLRRVIAERTKIIQSGVDNAQHAETILKQTKEEAAEVLLSAKQSAAIVQSDANRHADTIITTAETTAQEKAKSIIEQADKDIQKHRQLVETMIRNDSVDMIIASAKSVLQKELSNTANAKAHTESLIQKI